MTDSDSGARNLIYVSVITPEIQTMVRQGLYSHDVYNHDPAATEILLNMQVGESKSLHTSPSVESGFTFERKPGVQISSQTA